MLQLLREFFILPEASNRAQGKNKNLIPQNQIQVFDDGSQIERYSNGMVSKMKDRCGRAWSFTYAGQKLLRFTDPSNITWCEANGKWHGFSPCGTPVINRFLMDIQVDQVAAIVTICQLTKKIVFKLDGTKRLVYEKEDKGQTSQIVITESSASPRKVRVAVEKMSNGHELLQWIEDANGKTHCFEYDGDSLMKYMELGEGLAKSWQCHRDENNHIVRWSMDGTDGQESQSEMIPHLESVDLEGNRYFRSKDGIQLVVKPSGTASTQKESDCILPLTDLSISSMSW